MSLIAATLALTTMTTLQNGTPPPIMREFRGVWVATVDNIDWPTKRNLSAADQQRELLGILDLAAGMKLNAVILQVRPSADAFYPSDLEPWSEYLTGRQGVPPNPVYDPLAFAVDEAHKRGLELHCWFNPYRALHPAQTGPVASNHLSKTHPGIVKQYGKYMWMDPAEPAVQQRSLDVMLDVTRRYDIDGVHIDDYFYPYKSYANNADFPDEPSWQRYRASGGTLSRSDWRRKNVDDFIEKLYKGIKSTKKWVKFGISPFGIYRPGHPPSIKAGVDQYEDLYADARKWLVEGWCDYYTPQLYWPIAQTAQSYPVLLDWWIMNNPKGRHLWPGNFTGRTNPSDGNWKPKEVIDQINVTRSRNGATGNVHFSMKAFTRNFNGITAALRGGPYAGHALVPASPWLDNQAPGAPGLLARGNEDRSTRFTWSSTTASDPKSGASASAGGPAANDIMWWAVWRRYGNQWVSLVLPAEKTSMLAEPKLPSGDLSAFCVAAVDRCGNMSPITTWVPRQ